MPFIEQAVADAKEDMVVPEAEYDLEILSAELKTSKRAIERGMTASNMVSCAIAIRSEDYPNAATVFHHLMLVTDPDYEYNHLWLRDQKRFLVCFGIPFEANGFDVDDFQGATGRCLLKVGKNDRDEDVNVLALPKVKEEGEDNPGHGKRASDKTGKPRRRH